MPEWLRNKLDGFINSRDHTAEVNLAGYAFGVVAAFLVLMTWTIKGPRDGSLALAFGGFCTAVTTGLWKKGSNAKTSEQPRTEDEKGSE